MADDVHNHLGLPFLNVGERCNITGSIVFKKPMTAGKYAEAMYIVRVVRRWTARMMNGLAAMQKFVKIIVTEREIANVPFMLDASKFEIVLPGLKWCQGKPIVNSISLKVGEKLFE